ncbi:hypothetical protein IP87_02915 [beta proteobacterium AAP121]|nr:hypothetical protein IP80_11355 [beta proteobacterium AAP65]KPG00316.1 hypothetical protein IP87_02915 [beta proteobacterium AAP121]
MAELSSIEGGTLTKDKRPTFHDLLDKARYNFIQTGKGQIDKIRAGEGNLNKFGNLCTAWTEKVSKGYRVTFKSGASALEIVPGKTYFYVPDADAACELIAKCIIAAEGNMLDDMLVTTPKPQKVRTATAYVEEVRQSWGPSNGGEE